MGVRLLLLLLRFLDHTAKRQLSLQAGRSADRRLTAYCRRLGVRNDDEERTHEAALRLQALVLGHATLGAGKQHSIGRLSIAHIAVQARGRRVRHGGTALVTLVDVEFPAADAREHAWMFVGFVI